MSVLRQYLGAVAGMAPKKKTGSRSGSSQTKAGECMSDADVQLTCAKLCSPNSVEGYFINPITCDGECTCVADVSEFETGADGWLGSSLYWVSFESTKGGEAESIYEYGDFVVPDFSDGPVRV